MGRNISSLIGSVYHVPSLQVETKMQFPWQYWQWGLGLWCSLLKDLIFRQLTPSPDYNPPSPLSCEPLEILVVRRLLSISPTHPYLLDYYSDSVSLTLTIRYNLLWSLTIASDQFIYKVFPPYLIPPLPPTSLVSIVIDLRMIRSNR